MPSEGPPRSRNGETMPIRIGSSEEFARVRNYLRGIGFDEGAVSATLRIPDVSQIPNADPESADRGSASPALLAVIDLLVCGAAISADQIRASCGDAAFASFAALHLIRDARHQAGAVVCPVWVYPV